MYNVQTHFPRSMQRDEGKLGEVTRIKSRICADSDCAWSEGGPDLCFGFDRGDNTTFGTVLTNYKNEENT